MIDTDKYEGHSPAPWLRDSNDVHTNDGLRSIADVVILGDGDKLYRECVANARLIADAPLLLEEVKRLREQGRKLVEAAERVRSDISDQDTGWYYQLGNHIEKMNRLVSE